MGSLRAATVAAALGLHLCWILVGPAFGQSRPVSIELVLAIDSSASVDGSEYHLQLHGIAGAFRRPEIISAIEQYPDGVAVALVHWGGWAENILEPPWRLLDSHAAILEFTKEIEEVRRRHVGHLTAIGHAIDVAIELIESNDFDGRERKIDISGDGRNNSGAPPAVVRERARAKDITINGLSILTDDPGLFDYYNQEVATGPARFVLQADTYNDFAVAMAKKLYRELLAPVASAPDSTFSRAARLER